MKVFSVEKFKSSMDGDSVREALESGWPQKCEGLTAEEMLKADYRVNESWMIKKEAITVTLKMGTGRKIESFTIPAKTKDNFTWTIINKITERGWQLEPGDTIEIREES